MKVIRSISEKHRLIGLPEPLHPLVSVIKISDIRFVDPEVWKQFSVDFYCISLKKNVGGKARYGQQYYDYDKGVMTFVAPRQLLSLDETQTDILQPASGYALFVHADFLHGHALATGIRNYGFFSYAVNEALHLSEREERDIADLFEKIDREHHFIDKHTQSIILSQIELLLNYSNRFYERQFITRKKVNHDVLTKLERILDEHFNNRNSGLPTVEALSDQLHLSPSYLSDLLRSLTGQSAQQHIQSKIIEKAKEYLAGTQLSVAEIAYLLGYEHPQSFHKLFKRKTSLSPLAFRQALG